MESGFWPARVRQVALLSVEQAPIEYSEYALPSGEIKCAPKRAIMSAHILLTARKAGEEKIRNGHSG